MVDIHFTTNPARAMQKNGATGHVMGNGAVSGRKDGANLIRLTPPPNAFTHPYRSPLDPAPDRAASGKAGSELHEKAL